MISKKLVLGFIISPLATVVVVSAFAIVIVVLATNATLRDASNGINRLLLFSTILSYVIVIIVGIPLCILSIRRQWRKLWQNSLAGFSVGLGLGAVTILVITLLPSLKWMDPYSPFIAVFFFGITGSVTMSALWPFIEHNKAIQRAQ